MGNFKLEETRLVWDGIQLVFSYAREVHPAVQGMLIQLYRGHTSAGLEHGFATPKGLRQCRIWEYYTALAAVGMCIWT
jgi:hypothetical protein